MVTTKQKRKPKPVKAGLGNRKPYVKRACTNCKSAHTACDSERPCQRCVSLGLEESCVDSERKKPILRKPRKKKMKTEEEIEAYPSLKEYAPYLPPNSPTTSMVLSQGTTYPQNTTFVQPKLQNRRDGSFSFEFNPNSFQTPFHVTNLQQYNQQDSSLIPKFNSTKQVNPPYMIEAPNSNQPIVTNTNTGGDDQDDSVDLYMDLSNLSPDVTSSHFNPNDYISISPPTSPSIQIVNSQEEPTNRQLIPFSSTFPNEKRKGSLTNTQLEDLLKMVWQKQQIQSEEMKEIKKVVNDLKNLMISNQSNQVNYGQGNHSNTTAAPFKYPNQYNNVAPTQYNSGGGPTNVVPPTNNNTTSNFQFNPQYFQPTPPPPPNTVRSIPSKAKIPPTTFSNNTTPSTNLFHSDVKQLPESPIIDDDFDPIQYSPLNHDLSEPW
jgi:hypothetical protein